MFKGMINNHPAADQICFNQDTVVIDDYNSMKR